MEWTQEVPCACHWHHRPMADVLLMHVGNACQDAGVEQKSLPCVGAHEVDLMVQMPNCRECGMYQLQMASCAEAKRRVYLFQSMIRRLSWKVMVKYIVYGALAMVLLLFAARAKNICRWLYYDHDPNQYWVVVCILFFLFVWRTLIFLSEVEQ